MLAPFWWVELCAYSVILYMHVINTFTYAVLRIVCVCVCNQNHNLHEAHTHNAWENYTTTTKNVDYHGMKNPFELQRQRIILWRDENARISNMCWKLYDEYRMIRKTSKRELEVTSLPYFMELLKYWQGWDPLFYGFLFFLGLPLPINHKQSKRWAVV